MVPRSRTVVPTCHRKVACLFLASVDVIHPHRAGMRLQCDVVSLLAMTCAMTSHGLPMRGDRTLRARRQLAPHPREHAGLAPTDSICMRG
ncbi:hypothetical protein XAPC_305 [Xanthomonas citri pv. punicae str. LMG 859]|nr:hypothetical protein XAPC_305 [Xanthomonas citri pv. punicae str. LMG 859]